LPINAVFAALLAMCSVGLSVRVTVLRGKEKNQLFRRRRPGAGPRAASPGQFHRDVPMALI